MTRFPPEVEVLEEKLDEEVRNCYDAALARNILFHEELKTLVMQWRDEIHVLNLLGDENVNDLHRDYKMLPENLLKKCGLEAGVVNPYSAREKLPFIDEVGFSSTIFGLEWVYTNDGTLVGTARIPTWILKRDFPNASVFDYSS